MDLEILKECVLIQLSQMIQKIKNDEDYFKNVIYEPLFYGNQIWVGKEMDFMRMDLKISREKIRL